MIFRLMSPREQFLSYMDSYYRQHSELPTSCYVSRADLTTLMNSLCFLPPRDEGILTLFGVALHIQEDK